MWRTIFDGVDVGPEAGQTDVVVALVVEHSQIRGHDITFEEPGAAVEAGGHASGAAGGRERGLPNDAQEPTASKPSMR
eukprot:COSAG03_NODE_12388_length_549_cov_1.164444_1_plen_77_part_01